MLASINSTLRSQIKHHNVSDIIRILRENKAHYLESATLCLIADFLDGKIERRRGPKHKNTHYLNELVFLRIRYLQSHNHSFNNAVEKVSKVIGMSGIEGVKKQFTAGRESICKPYEGAEPEDLMKWGTEIQNLLNDWRKSANKEPIILF